MPTVQMPDQFCIYLNYSGFFIAKKNDFTHEQAALTMKKIFTTWFPLMGSWLMMSLELPVINAIIARLANPDINLAAYGGVVYPIALTIEAPVIMMLAASTAMSKDWKSYQRLKKITLIMGGILSILHFIVAITPIYDWIVTILLGAPQAVIEPARQGLLLLSPWTLAIAYRRFQQGAMIRFNRSHMVSEITLVRLITVAAVLSGGLFLKTIPGATLAGLAQGVGVSAEAIFAGLRARKIRFEIESASTTKTPLSMKRFIRFYIPLAATSSLWLLWQPLISAAVSRMPNPLESLAIWSVLTGLLFIFRSPGVAYNEAVVALLDESRSFIALRKFAHLAAAVVCILAIGFVVTPLSDFWFSTIASLTQEKALIARIAISLGIPLTFLQMYISLFQGIIVSKEKTGPVAEAVVLFLVSMLTVLVIGVVTAAYKGVYVAVASFTIAHISQVLWLLIRSRKNRKLLAEQQLESCVEAG